MKKCGECAGVEPASILWYRNPIFKHSHLFYKLSLKYSKFNFVGAGGFEPPIGCV